MAAAHAPITAWVRKKWLGDTHGVALASANICRSPVSSNDVPGSLHRQSSICGKAHTSLREPSRLVVSRLRQRRAGETAADCCCLSPDVPKAHFWREERQQGTGRDLGKRRKVKRGEDGEL